MSVGARMCVLSCRRMVVARSECWRWVAMARGRTTIARISAARGVGGRGLASTGGNRE